REALLHADFHHYNVLASDADEWVAIDPKGMRGDPGYEVGPFMCNPWPVESDVLRRRLDILSEELEYDRQRLRTWCTTFAVLSAWWNIEDRHSGWRITIAIAERLVELK